MRSFSGLEKNSVAVARLIVVGYFLQIVGSVYLGHLLLDIGAGWFGYVSLAALMIFIATRFRGLNNIVHECSHATFAKDRAENARLGSLCASVILGCYNDYRDEHLTHHKHLGNYEHDLDLQGIEDLKLHEPLSLRSVLRHIFTPLVGRHLPYYLGVNMSARDGKGYLAFKLLLIATSFTLLAVAPMTAVMMVFVPYCLIYSALNYWTDCLDHAGIVASDDELDSSRNMLAPLPLRLLIFPRDDCYHLVHHLFPQVPSKHLGAVHAVLEHDEIYASKPHATRRIQRDALRKTPLTVAE